MKIILFNQISVDGSLTGFEADLQLHYSLAPKADIHLGSRSGTLPFNGSIDELRIFNRSFTSDEVLAIYNSTKPYFIENETVSKTNATGYYNYTFTTPSTTGGYIIKVNSTYNGEYGDL